MLGEGEDGMHIQGRGRLGMRAAPHLMSIKTPFWGLPLRKCGEGSQDTRQGCATARTPCSPVYTIVQEMI